MVPYVKGNSVIVEDGRLASTLMNKGDFGRPKKGGALELSLLEAAYLMDSERIEVRSSRKGRLLSHHHLISMGIDLHPRFLEDYIVFRDIRNRGINIQGGDDRIFISYPRGKRPGKGRADRWIEVYREHDRVVLSDLLGEAKRREGMRMELISAVVDGDWDLTYYSARPCLRKSGSRSPSRGKNIDIGSIKHIPGEGSLIWDREDVETVKENDMGTDISGARLLSSHESDLLIGDGGDGGFKDRTYRDLESRGFLVRTGFKYGSHFRVYTSGTVEEHSDLLVHCIGSGEGFTWEELSRAIRLSHSVRKRMIFSIEIDGGPQYLEITWTKP